MKLALVNGKSTSDECLVSALVTSIHLLIIGMGLLHVDFQLFGMWGFVVALTALQQSYLPTVTC